MHCLISVAIIIDSKKSFMRSPADVLLLVVIHRMHSSMNVCMHECNACTRMHVFMLLGMLLCMFACMEVCMTYLIMYIGSLWNLSEALRTWL